MSHLLDVVLGDLARDEDDAVVDTGRDEGRVLREEAVAGVHRLATAGLRSRDWLLRRSG